MTAGAGVASAAGAESGAGLAAALQSGVVPGLATVTGTAVFGLAVAASVWLVRLAIRRRRRSTSSGSPEALGLEPDADGVAVAASHGSAAADVAFTLSLPGPGSVGVARPVRHAEVYAVELGLVAGGLAAWLASLASVDPLVGGVVGTALGGFSLWRVRSMAVETARQEATIWLVSTAVGLVAGWLLFF